MRQITRPIADPVTPQAGEAAGQDMTPLTRVLEPDYLGQCTRNAVGLDRTSLRKVLRALAVNSRVQAKLAPQFLERGCSATDHDP